MCPSEAQPSAGLPNLAMQPTPRTQASCGSAQDSCSHVASRKLCGGQGPWQAGKGAISPLPLSLCAWLSPGTLGGRGLSHQERSCPALTIRVSKSTGVPNTRVRLLGCREEAVATGSCCLAPSWSGEAARTTHRSVQQILTKQHALWAWATAHCLGFLALASLL